MATAGTAYIDIDADTTKLKRNLDTTVRNTGASVEARFKKSFGRAAAIAGGAFLAQKGLQFAGGAVNEARESAKVGRQTEAVIKSTGGAANVTAGQVDAYAGKLSKMAGVDDELIASGQNVLLTFTDIKNGAGAGNDVFNQTTAAALDMSAALGTDLQGNVMTLGKALNDPVKGMSKLQRAGVTFTDQQKEQVKALVESGDTLGAQKIILKELRKEFGGSAKAAADPMKKLAVAGENLKEKFGAALLPILSKVADGFSKIVEFVSRNSAVIGPIIAVLAGLAAVIYTIVTATKIWTAIQLAFNVVMSANPIVLVVLGLVALGAALVVAYKKVGWFRKFVDAAWQAIQKGWDALLTGFKWAWDNIGKPAFEFIKTAISLWWNYYVKPIFAALKVVFEGVWKGIKWAWEHIGKPVFAKVKEIIEKLVPVFEKAKDGIKAAWDKIGDAIKWVYDNVIKPIIDKIQAAIDIVDRARGIVVGSTAITDQAVAALPGRASGGPVTRGRTYLVGERGPEIFTARESGVIIPNGRAGSKSLTINNYYPASTDLVLAAARRQERLYG